MFSFLGLAACASRQQTNAATTPTHPTKLSPLSSTELCQHCTGTLLPGRIVHDEEFKYDIHSDLPESFEGTGVLYTTAPVLPPFQLLKGDELSLDQRTQRSNGFTTIDASFEAFLFHIARPGDGTQPRRIVILVQNDGDVTVTARPRQIIKTEGTIGTAHEFESTLGRRVMEGDWETKFDEVVIKPGEAGIVAFSKQFAAPQDGDDISRNINCFGRVQVPISYDGAVKPKLTVSVVAIAGVPDREAMLAMAEGELHRGAKSLEQWIDFTTAPVDCQLRRATGVAPVFRWESDQIHINASEIPADGFQFQMALPAIQSSGCEEARQTADLLLHPPYTRPDTIGNYMIPYYTTMQFTNDTDTPRTIDLTFGKKDADVGLVWQLAKADSATEAHIVVDQQNVVTGWAGPKQEALTRSFLTDGELTLQPGETRAMAIKYMILGNSSLPYQIYLRVVD